MQATWAVTIEEFDTVVEDFFLKNTLVESVKAQCTVFANQTMAKRNLQATQLFSEMSLLEEQATTRRLETERLALEQQLADALKEIDELWWQANLPYMIAFAALGVGVMIVVFRMFAAAKGTCGACCACCVD